MSSNIFQISMASRLVVNLSRLGKRGTGLSVFSRHVLDCLRGAIPDYCVVASDDVNVDSGIEILRVPTWVAMTPVVSKLRPVLWLVYAWLRFPGRNEYVLSTTHQIVPRVRHQVVTVHDLRPYFFPDSVLQGWYFRYVLPRALRNVDGILTVSEVTKQELVARYRSPVNKIHVVANCVDTNRFARAGERLQSSKPYLLVVGATWKHKNAHELIENYEAWANQYQLKILAGNSAYARELRELVQCNGVAGVEFVEYVSEHELISLYQGAAALVYPSVMEGFGIPPLEAAACGTPVIVSDIGVFREIYGDFPIYVTLGKPESWRIAFQQLENSSVVEEKIRQGIVRVGQFNKQRMCDELHSALRAIWPEIY